MTRQASITSNGGPQDTGPPEIMLDKAELARGGVRVLGPMSLQLPVRRLGIVGRNGSGKSSLLRLLSGLAPPSAGRVRIAGIDPATDRAAAIRTVGILFQNPDHQIIFPTVAEELAFGLEQIGLTRPSAAARVAVELVRHGRADWGPRQVQSLSEGQRRWLCLMAVLAMGPRVLLLDEPFAGLDIPTITALEAEFAALPLALVTITHDPAQLADYDHILWLEGGMIAAQGHPDAILPEYLAEMRRLGARGLC
jgi:biotin transport system ATP-binding protein